MYEEETKTSIDLTYVGRRMTNDGKLIEAWQDQQGKLRLYTKFRPLRCAIGITFTIDDTPGGIMISSARNPRKNHDTEEIAQWEVRDKDAWNDYQERQLVKRLGKTSAFSDAFAPIKRIYNKTPVPARQAFVLMMLHELGF